jgi:Predicted transcriptional regulators
LKTKIELYVINAVRSRRLEQKMSQATLAYCINVSRGFVGDVENPKMPAKYNLNHLNEIAKVFNCSPKEFLPDYFIE